MLSFLFKNEPLSLAIRNYTKIDMKLLLPCLVLLAFLYFWLIFLSGNVSTVYFMFPFTNYSDSHKGIAFFCIFMEFIWMIFIKLMNIDESYHWFEFTFLLWILTSIFLQQSWISVLDKFLILPDTPKFKSYLQKKEHRSW